MAKKFTALLLLVIFFNFFVDGSENHLSSYPFISGDTFWNFCDFVIDEKISFNPAAVKRASTILVQEHLFDTFFSNYYPFITEPFIIVTPNCGTMADDPVPGKFRTYLDDDKIVAWFTQNVDGPHPKLYPIPIGLANRDWGHGNIKTFKHFLKRLDKAKRDKLLYMNFTQSHPERNVVYKYFSEKSFCTVSKTKGLSHYLKDLCEHKFNLSPRGGGIDCHRTWESLLMGCYPIVKRSTLEPLYKDLPIVIIDEWEEVTEEFLNKKYEELSQGTYNYKKLYAKYWFREITKVKESYINNNVNMS